MKNKRKPEPMSELAEPQFDCLNAISDMGALCQSIGDKGEPTGMFKAIASPRVNSLHPGWPTAVINALYLRKLITRNESGEYTITMRGKTACIAYQAKREREAVIMA